MAESVTIAAAACERILRDGTVGRVAFSTPIGPEMVPVDYSVVDDAIFLRTPPYSRLGTYGRDALLVFEVDGLDGLDEVLHRGWCVQARGRSKVVSDPDALARIRQSWLADPQATSQRHLVLRMRWTGLVGRPLTA